MIEINSFNNGSAMKTVLPKANVTKSERGSLFSQLMDASSKKCPYSYLAKDGVVDYKGLAFVCDFEHNSLCLGDMTDSKRVLNISLPSGGSLRVNYDNIGDLQRAVGMFSPEDLNAIMRAIAQFNHCTSKLNELDEQEHQVVESVTEKSEEVEK